MAAVHYYMAVLIEAWWQILAFSSIDRSGGHLRRTHTSLEETRDARNSHPNATRIGECQRFRGLLLDAQAQNLVDFHFAEVGYFAEKRSYFNALKIPKRSLGDFAISV